MELSYSLAGAFTGFIVGLTGVGGGALMTPILLLFFGVAPVTAVATDLWFATITKIAALIIHHRQQQVDWQIVRRLWYGSIPAAILVVFTIISSQLVTINSHWLTFIVGLVILITALGLILKPWLKPNVLNYRKSHFQSWRIYQPLLTILFGVVLGILVTLTSVGAGALGSIILLYLYPVRLTPHQLVGSDIAHAIPLALIAGFGYLIIGKVNYHLLFLLISASVPFALLGSFISTRFSHSKLRLCLAVILSLSGLKLVIS
ncbi:sulfite exporter TauE/SafE family protein [Legionella israelensis]|uniref:Probable membrane transporter protein n=1 Tax=Legionella israelensis TaxID=454 RepID=A0A0W0WNT9_9GAMM|nr:sulfite exporter TauE/SafE family protein [Legionella israelensis]KTD33993.1 Sulfite exporter TauE/SafE [Legionella israelensis]QBS10672.1 sulfite exporter TauE/SafE family protein [Legionella israelensis]SCX84051.1 hypothetical protein SAMN02746069_00393 [Legionella israelensis DSM 19235]STX57627.1 Sulfite exporter TauE/SafE [Legionella israelensis]